MLRPYAWFGLVMVVLACLGTLRAAAGEPRPYRVYALQCEYGVDPAGVDVAQPRLMWKVDAGERGQVQTAYQVLVASSKERLARGEADLWDSGRVASNQTTFVEYAGQMLKSSQRVFWQVRSWDRDDKAATSEPATWTMGLLDASHWKGRWITVPTPRDPKAAESYLMRRGFSVKAGLRRAIVHATGLGQYELSFNGRRVGDALLTPGWTDYRDTILYDTHDVTDLLKEGGNAVGMLLGNGMYHTVRVEGQRFSKFVGTMGPTRALLHLRLEYADGTVDYVGTDESWTVAPGPLTWNTIYGGEDYDARLLPGGWDTVDLKNGEAWPHAVPFDGESGALKGFTAGAPPVKVVEVRKPAGSQTFADGSVVYDFGQNASFMPKLTITGPAGSSVRLIPAELVNPVADGKGDGPPGTIYRLTMGGTSRGISWWSYTKATDGPETYFPHFYYLGSRYVKAEFTPAQPGGALPRIEGIESHLIQSATPAAGTFATDSELVNRIRDIVRWAQRSNLVSIITDCPHREKLGWLEQSHLNGPSLRYEWDLGRQFTKAIGDMHDAQLADGSMPNVAPEYVEFKGAFRHAAEWGAAAILVPWQQYRFYGDERALRDSYEPMKRYFASIEAKVDGEGLLNEGLGDWFDVGPKKSGASQNTPPPITATAFLYLDAKTLADVATATGRADEAAEFAAKAERIRASYNRKFYDAAAGSYATGSQASNAIALDFGLCEPANRERVLAALIADIERNGFSTTTGGVGHRSSLRALADAGRSDVVLKMVTQDEKPGYAFQVRRGETTLTEAWNANGTTSHNHFMLGHVTEWFYKDLAGIDVDASSPGFAHVVLRPDVVAGLNRVAATYDSIRGPIASTWARDGDRLTFTFDVPANTTATIEVPARPGAAVEVVGGEQGVRAAAAAAADATGGRRRYEVGSGRYTFVVRD